MGLGQSIKRWGHGKQLVRVAFDPYQPYAHLAMEALVWTLEDRGIQVSDEVLESAVIESAKYPQLTVKKFVDGFSNSRMNSALR